MGGCSSHGFPSEHQNSGIQGLWVRSGAPDHVKCLSDKMHLKSNAGRNIVKDSCPIIGDSPPNFKRQKVAAVKDCLNHRTSFISTTNGGESEGYANQDIRCSDGEKYTAAAIPAVPLRSLSPLDVQLESENSPETNDKDDSDGQKLANDYEDKDGSTKDMWNSDLEKLTALVAQAKEYIRWFNIRYSGLKEVPLKKSHGVCQIASTESDVLHKGSTSQEPKPSVEIMQLEETATYQKLGESVTLQDLEGRPENMMKVDGSILKACQAKKPSLLESKLDNNEEEICVLSPTQWNTLRQRSKLKCDDDNDEEENCAVSPTRWNTLRQCSKLKCDDDNNEEEICVLSPTRWNTLRQRSKLKCDDDIFSTGKKRRNSQLWTTCKSVGECNKMVGNRGIEVIDLELIETECGETHWERDSVILDECTSLEQKKEDELLAKLGADNSSVNAEHYDLVSQEMGRCSVEHKYHANQEELINLSIVPHYHPQGSKVRRVLKLFQEQHTRLLKELRAGKRKGTYPHFEAAARLRAEGMCIFAEKPFGHIPGIEIGDEFQFRSELVVVGLHCQLTCGIDCVVLDGKKFATSVVNLGRYENETKEIDVLIYSVQGGNPKIAEKSIDQKLEKGNLGLMNSLEMKYPVRVTHKRNSEGNFVYIYDGLYIVCRMWEEADQHGKLIFNFELHRMPGQPRPPQQTKAESLKQMKPGEVCVEDDISEGKENLPIRAINRLDDERYLPFTYITNILYPTWYQHNEPIGCNCTNGCSDSHPCPCVSKNGGEIPFNERGEIIRARPIVHECGPSCKCPPSCMNRVSQHGPGYQLEIFKTIARGWGVRSRNYISSGSFICEYVGELLEDKEAEQRINNDEYLFDICDDRDEGTHGEYECLPGSKTNDDGFAIDAAKFGNIGRFINHSCSPNLYAQKVLYDHSDIRMPHIMFFATRKIPPLQELYYDYNYKMDRVCDVNGNIKTKECYCGSRRCKGRMY